MNEEHASMQIGATMEISVFRIDDRLIHGQIITAWIAYADAKQIVVADDLAAKDEFQQSLLKMATPNTITLKILSIQDTIELYKSDTETDKVLLLVRGAKEAFELVEAGVWTNSINVGNMNMKKGKKKVLGNMWVFPKDLEYLEKIDEMGVNLEVRAVPNDRSQDVMNLIKKL